MVLVKILNEISGEFQLKVRTPLQAYLLQIQPIEKFVIAIVFQLYIAICDSLLRGCRFSRQLLDLAQRLLNVMDKYTVWQYAEIPWYFWMPVLIRLARQQCV